MTLPRSEGEIPSAEEKSGPSGITMVKSRTLTNCTAPTRKMTRRSETLSIGRGIVRWRGEARMTAIDWLQTFLRQHGAVAGTVHRRVSDELLALDAAVNIPEPVQRATRE